ncbi:MAG: hypothetical protein F6K48_00605 [Okeania sp. SIO3H1]|nr:hypothetical protein [Okeania sp. SIO3H1]
MESLFALCRRQETTHPLTPPRRGGEKRVGSEEVGAGVLSQDCSAIVSPKY